MLFKVAPAEQLGSSDTIIKNDWDSVTLEDPQHQRGFNNFKLWNSSLLFHILVLLAVSGLNFYFLANIFRGPITVLIVIEVVIRVLSLIGYAMFSLYHFWLEKKVSWSKWVGRLKANMICNLGMLTVIAISVVQIFTILETAKEDRDIAVTFFFAVVFQAIIVRLIFPVADWWAGPLVCIIACGLCTVTAFAFEFPFQMVFRVILLFGASVYSDYENYKRNLHHFTNYTNLGHATRTAMENEQKQKQAEYASKEMRSFIGNIAHDLKTPLQSFVSELDLMGSSNGEESKKASVGALQSLCSFMLMTINRSLDFVKSESGVRLVPSNSTVNLKESLNWVVDCIQRTSHAVELILTEPPPEICDFVITDKQWLEENLLCLVSNATKFTTLGSIVIKVMLDINQSPEDIVTPEERNIGASDPNSDIEAQQECSRAPSIEMLLFEVEDTGIGLSEEQMKSLFQPFQQAQRKAGGTGLGLYALARRVDAIGGKYGVRGRHDGGRGCLFWFTVPYRPDFTTISVKYSGSARFNSWDSVNKQNVRPKPEEWPVDMCLRVLLVDDSPLIQKTTAKILNRANHSVSSAMNGSLCLDVLSERVDDFDVILMDIQMPVMDGIETIRRIREKEAAASWSDKGSRRQFVIGLSANSDSETRTAALEAGMDDFVPKPLTLALFEKAVGGRTHV